MSLKTSLPLYLAKRMKHDRVPGIGIAVFREGRMDWAEGFGEMESGTRRKVTADTPFHACSMSKMVTAIGVLRLVQEGVLELDEDVNRYLVSWQVPESGYTAQKKVTLRNLLAHQAGFVDPEGSFDVYREHDPFPSLHDLLAGNTRYNPEAVRVSYVPESQFSYSDAGYCVVEQLVEDVTGESFSTAMDRLVMAPLAMQQTFFWDTMAGKDTDEAENRRKAREVAGHDREGRIVEGKRACYPFMAGAGLWTTPADFASLTLQVTAAWNGDTRSILLPEMSRAMLTGFGCDPAVGLGVFVPQDEKEPYLISKGWGIGFQCMLLAYPRLQSGVVVMANSDPGVPQNESLVGEVIRQIAKEYDWPGMDRRNRS